MVRNKKRTKPRKKPRKKQPTPHEAAELLEQDAKARVKAVEEGITALLREQNCEIDFIMSISTKRGVLGGDILVVPGPPLPPPPKEPPSPTPSDNSPEPA